MLVRSQGATSCWLSKPSRSLSILLLLWTIFQYVGIHAFTILPRCSLGQRVQSSSVLMATMATDTTKLQHTKPLKNIIDGDTEVFCNREINMQQIRAVGFDMDYTLAQYNLDFELLAYEGAKVKLVENLGYPVSFC